LAGLVQHRHRDNDVGDEGGDKGGYAGGGGHLVSPSWQRRFACRVSMKRTYPHLNPVAVTRVTGPKSILLFNFF
jgi:hypothetical protein